MTEGALVKLEQAEQMLEEVRCTEDAIDLANIAAAAEHYAAKAKLGEKAVHHASSLKVRAERMAGQFLRKLPRSKPGRPEKNSPGTGELTPYAETLRETGLSHQRGSELQALADVPQKDFDAYVQDPRNAASARKVVTRIRHSRQRSGNTSFLKLARTR